MSKSQDGFSISPPPSSNAPKCLGLLNLPYVNNVKEHAAKHYKVDFKKWTLNITNIGTNLEKKKRRDRASIMCKKQIMIEIGPDRARLEEPEDDNKALTMLEGPTPRTRRNGF
ncbi:hypothetical protein BYT27DRAFT_7210891 [Phlegmacium glaucopus]|nr:hypothetical protein BYT27DRAFT_7210891 [Phlegmacium glaucopus]